MAKVPSVEEFMNVHRKEILRRAKAHEKELLDKIIEIPKFRHPDYKPLVEKKISEGGGFSYSSMKRFRESPISLIQYLTEKEKKTEALFTGSVVDQLITEPKKFSDKYFIIPEKVSRQSNEGKAIYSLYEECAGDRMVIDIEEYENALEISKHCWGNDDARFYLERIQKYQIPISFIHRATKYPVRGYVDFASAEEPEDCEFFIGDLKTGMSAEKDKFTKQAANLWYHGQSGTYTMAYKYKWKFPAFMHIVVEKTPPYNVNVFRSEQDWITEAQEEVEITLLSIKYCMENNLWHKSYDFVRDETLTYTNLSKPSYYKPKL